jgi:hypothetical protein
MKFKKLYEHRWPILVILFCALGIYFILYKKEVEYYENQIEKIEDFKSEKFSKEQLLNAMTNPDYTFMLANGHWTSKSSDLVKEKVKNAYRIHVSREGKGKITLNKEEYKINLFTNMKLTGIDKKDKNKSITFEFLLPEKDIRNPLRQDGIPRAKVSIHQKDNLISSFYSYKLFELHGIGGELSRIILSQHYQDPPSMQYDIHTYQKYIGNFKFPFKPFSISYGSTTSGKFYDKIKKDYDGKIILAYKREYYTHGKETLMTPLSKTYELDGINRQNKLFNEMTLSDIEEEKRINLIKKGFIPKATYIYIYKVKSVKNKYSFEKTNNENKRSFDLLNNATSIFSKNDINLPILNDTLLTMEGTYTPILCKTVKMGLNNEKMKIKITAKDVENVL